MRKSNFFDNKKILVTGGAGFIGGAFIEKLLYESSSELFNLDKLSYASIPCRFNFIFESNQFLSKRYHFLNFDLIDKTLLNDAIKEIQPDFIVHFAAESHVDRSIKDPSNFINSNIIGTYNLLNSALLYWDSINDKSKKDNFRFLHISTDEVFGSVKNNQKFDEATAYSPRSPYSASKAASDHLVNAWHHTYGLPILLTNCSNNYGPWQFPEKLIPLTILKAFNKEPIPIYGDGKNIRDWLHVEDHINAIILVLEKGILGNSYCIGGFGEKTNLEVVNYICNTLDQLVPEKRPHNQLITFVKDRAGHDKRYAINSKKISSELGWHPNYSTEEGMKSTIKWYLSNVNLMMKILKKSVTKTNRIEDKFN